MTKKELLVSLKQIADGIYVYPAHGRVEARAIEDDQEEQHQAADMLLCQYINDPEIVAAYDAISKWYA